MTTEKLEELQSAALAREIEYHAASVAEVVARAQLQSSIARFLDGVTGIIGTLTPVLGQIATEIAAKAAKLD